MLGVVLAALIGCQDGGTDAPRLDAVSPAVVPAYAGGELLLSGAGFFPVMGVSTSSGQAVVDSQAFSLRLSPSSAAPDPSCTPEVVRLDSVSWQGASTLVASIPTDLCAAEYLVSVIDPRGVETVDDVRLNLSAVWPDHLAIAEGGCAEVSYSAVTESTLTLDNEALFSIRVVGPHGEPARTFPPGLERAAPLAAALSVVAEASDDLVAAQLMAPSLTSGTPSASELARFEGNLSAVGCAEVMVKGTAAGRLRLGASSQSLPRLGEGPSAVDVLIQPGGDLVLGLAVPERVVAGESFAVSVQMRDRVSGEPVVSADGCVELRANDQDLNLLGALSAGDGVECTAGLLPLVSGRWEGSVSVQEARERAFLLASTQYGIFGASDFFEVVSGDAERLVLTTPSRVVAGEHFAIAGELSDRYGNPIAINAAILEEPDDETGTLACQELDVDGARFVYNGCTMTDASVSNRIRVNYGEVVGISPQLETAAGPVAQLMVEIEAGAKVAGSSFLAVIQVFDAFGNLADAASGPVTLGLTSESALSASSVQLRSGVLTAQLTAYVAGMDELEIAFEEVSASAPLQVVAASIDRFRVARSASGSVVAGEPVDLTVSALDPWDNRVLGYSAPLGLNVTDSAGAELLAEGGGATFIDGQARFPVTLTIARSAEQIRVNDGLGHAGLLDDLTVVPGPLRQFAVAVGEGAYFVEEHFYLEIRAEDSFGNLVADYDGTVSYSDSTRSVSPAFSGPFEGGVRRERFSIGEALDDNVLTVSVVAPDGVTVTSRSAPFLVLNFCQGGMTVDMELINLDDEGRGTLCLQNRFGSTDLEAIAHTEGASTSLVRYIWSDGDVVPGPPLQNDSHTYSFEDEGYYPLSVTAYEPNNLCGVRSTREIFVGRAGYPAGPLELSADQLILNAGYADGSEQAKIAVSGRDCAGEAASKSVDLTVLSSYGDVLAPDIAPARPGIQTSMVNGKASFSLSVGNEQQSTVATVVAGAANGSCFGSLDLEVRNDILNPWVVDYGPSGNKEGLIPTAWVRFSEPMLPESIIYNDYVTITVGGGSRQLVRGEDYSLSLDDARTVLTFTFLPEGRGLDATEGPVRVTLPSELGGFNVEDENGKRLDGNWDGQLDSNDGFSFEFGSFSDTQRPEVLGCQPSPILYTPSQYDASQPFDHGITIDISLSDDIQLRSWRLEVYDLQGSTLYEKYGLVETRNLVQTQAVWFGVSMDGPVVPNGTYWFEVSAIDVVGNHSQRACQGWVEIANPLDLTPL